MLILIEILILVFVFSRIIISLFYKPLKAKQIDNTLKKLSTTIIIPVFNEEQHIKDTVLRACALADEVIVVNDGSTDLTRAKLEKVENNFKNLKVSHFSTNQGKKKAMAFAIEQATGDIIIQLDSDSQILSGFNNLIGYFEDEKIGAVVANSVPFPVINASLSQKILNKMQRAYYWISFSTIKGAEDVQGNVLCCSGCCSAYRKSALEPVIQTWLSETFLGKEIKWGDDRALTNQMIKSGLVTKYSHSALAGTYAPDKWGKFIKQQLRWKKGWFVNTIKIIPYLFKKRTLYFLTYVMPLFLITVTTPIIFYRVFISHFLLGGISPDRYFIVIIIISILVILFNFLKFRKINSYNYIPLSFLFPNYIIWTLVNIFLNPILLIWALLDITNQKWGTR